MNMKLCEERELCCCYGDTEGLRMCRNFQGRTRKNMCVFALLQKIILWMPVKTEKN